LIVTGYRHADLLLKVILDIAFHLRYQVSDMRRLTILVLLVGLNPFGNAQAASAPHPKWAIELKAYGWSASKPVSNKAFFKDFSLAKLEAMDPNTRASFVNDDVIVAYHTKQEGQDWRTTSRQLEAFFISAKDGQLLRKKEWPTVVRGSETNLQDSESRLIPLRNGRFLVFANRTMMLYGSDLELIAQKKLEPSTLADLWSVQSVAGGQKSRRRTTGWLQIHCFLSRKCPDSEGRIFLWSQ